MEQATAQGFCQHRAGREAKHKTEYQRVKKDRHHARFPSTEARSVRLYGPGVLNQIALSAFQQALIAAWSDAIGGAKMPVEMALISKPQLMRDVAGRGAAAQESLGTTGTQLHRPLPGAQPGFFLEGAQQVEFGQAQLVAQLVQRQRLAQLLGEQLLGPVDHAFAARGSVGQAHAAGTDHFTQQQNQGVFVNLAEQWVVVQGTLDRRSQALCQVWLKAQRAIKLQLGQPRSA